jgi:hypothetical protein
MPELDFITIFVTRLNRTGARYMITGAVACAVYGVPRLTNDVDLVLEVGTKSVENVLAAFPPDAFYCPPREIVMIEAERPLRGHFNLVHHDTGLRADVYTLGEDPLHDWAIANRNSFELQGERVWLAPPEYVILRKLESYREGGCSKHLMDIAGILELSSDELKTDWLQEKIHEYGLTREWKKAKEMLKD